MKAIEGYNVRIYTDNIEDSASEQIKELLSIDVFSKCKIRIMPDVHAGAGCVIGFTGDLGDKVIPNIVGVDIGCGILVQPFVCVGDMDYLPPDLSYLEGAYREDYLHDMRLHAGHL